MMEDRKMLPKDPIMLLSLVNTKLRDEYADLDELCAALDEDRQELEKRLAGIGYYYDRKNNCFK